MSSATPLQIRSYISDMLSELADLARGLHDRRLERSMRLLALDVAASRPADDSDAPAKPDLPH